MGKHLWVGNPLDPFGLDAEFLEFLQLLLLNHAAFLAQVLEQDAAVLLLLQFAHAEQEVILETLRVDRVLRRKATQGANGIGQGAVLEGVEVGMMKGAMGFCFSNEQGDTGGRGQDVHWTRAFGLRSN